jgi:hypothetical protein
MDFIAFRSVKPAKYGNGSRGLVEAEQIYE